MNEIVDEPQAQPGTRYPFIPLRKALERAKQLHDETGDHAVLVTDAVHLWGYNPKTSGGRQTIAALKRYGLLTDSGRKDDRKLKLTTEARRYFLDERPEKRTAALKHFVLCSDVMAALWKMWGDRPPSDSIARSLLKIDFGYAENAAEELLAIYTDNIAFAKLTSSGRVSAPSTDEGGDQVAGGGGAERPLEVGDFVQWVDANGVLRLPGPVQITGFSEDGTFVFIQGSNTGLPMDEVRLSKPRDGHEQAAMPPPPSLPPAADSGLPPVKPGVRQDVCNLAEGTVVLSFPERFSQESYEDLEAWLDWQKTRLRRWVR